MAVNAIHMTDTPPVRYEQWYWEKCVKSVANYTRQDAREFLELAATVPIRATIECHPLAEANHALVRLKRGEVHGAAVLEVR